MTESADELKPRRRTLRWVIATVCVVALSGAAWWASGRRFYTDDRTIHARAGDASVREILWTRPQAPSAAFNSADEEYEPSVSPDGAELYFVRGKAGRNAEIFVSRREHGRWTAPAPLAGINSAADDLGPRLTPDGRFLLFYSDRAGGIGGYDLWAAARNDDGSWGEPFNLGPEVNSEFNDYSPAPTPDGKRLYFASNRRAAAAEQKEAWRATIRQSAVGDYDLFVADVDASSLSPVLGGEGRGGGPDGTTAPATQPAASQPVEEPPSPALPPEYRGEGERLTYRAASEVPAVNTPSHDGAPYVSPAGDFLYFASNRPGGLGKFDIYRSRLRDDGALSAPENLGREINTPENETDPALAVGGFHLYFSSDRDSASAAGGYDLLASESREVYVRRVPRTAPTLGWSWWVLIGALALLLPLLSMFRGWNDHRLNLLQKCLLVSVLLHVLLTIAMSLMVVSKQIVELVRSGDGGGGMEGTVAVVSGGGGGGGVDIGAEIRRQVTDTPVAMPEPQGLGQAQVSAEELTPQQAAELSVNVPGAARPPADVMTIPVRPAARDAATSLAAADRVTVPQPTQVLPPAAPELRFDNAAMRVSQLEPAVRTAPDAAGAAGIERAAATPAPAETLQAVALGVGTTDASGAGAGTGSALSAVPHLVRPNFLSIDPPGGVGAAGRGAGAGAVGAGVGPVIAGPSISSERVAAASPGTPGGDGAGPAGASLGRQDAGVDGATGSGPGELLAGAVGIPAADRAGAAGTPGADGAGPVGAPAPTPRIDAVAGASNGTGPAPTVTVAPLTAGLPASAGSGTKPVGPVTSPAPALAAREESLPSQRATSAGAGGGLPAEAERPAGGIGDTVALGPVSPGTGATAVGSAIAAPGATTRPVAPGATGATGESTSVVTPRAPEVVALSAPSLPGGVGPARRAGSGNVSPGPSVPTTADEPNFGGARLASAREDRPVGPGSLPSSFGPPSAAPAIGPAAGAGGGLGGSGVGPRPRGGDVVSVPLNLEVAIAAPRVAAPEPLAQRSVAARKPLLERLGGTKQSEDAVERALAYLARQQEPDGRWTYVLPNSERGRRGRYPHDTALTGLATLCFLAADHTPNRTGPYREAVEAAVEFLIASQRPDGDLRGPMAGGGADAGNLYDQGIATLALSEAALMTGDARIIAAATKGAEYIVRAQHRGTGGWRYIPGESGDTSIFGWQVMALHSAQQLGFDWPEASRELAKKYVRITSQGRHKSLGGYQPGNSPTPAMSAELLLARILLGEKLSAEAEEEVCKFLPRQSSNDFYGTYYASLSLVQLQNETWKKWNEKTRENLIRQQRRGGGDDDGCWDMHITWGERAGRVYSTALGCLTLEVYYRYLPVNEGADGADGAASQPAEGPVRPDIGYLAR